MGRGDGPCDRQRHILPGKRRIAGGVGKRDSIGQDQRHRMADGIRRGRQRGQACLDIRQVPDRRAE